ncbi:hypothetical protein EON80_14695 [bacterium]|nr:MAG: hypothetical protein EON80_14695 [bacterium]
MRKTSIWFVSGFVALYASLAVAQLANPAKSQKVPDLGPAEHSVQPGKAITLTLNYQDVDAVDLLKKIAIEGNLQLMVRGDVEGLVEEIRLKEVDPEIALQKVAEEAGLDLKLANHVYIVKPKTSLKPAEEDNRVSLSFEDVEVSFLLNIIGQQFGVKVSVSPDIDSKIKVIELKNRSAIEEIELICQVANLTCKKEGNTYFVSKPDQP